MAKVGELVATAEAKLGIDPVQSVRASLAAAKLQTSDRVEDSLRDSLQALQVRGILAGGGGAVSSTAFSPDDSLVATSTDKGFVRIFRAATHRRLLSLDLGSAVSRSRSAPTASNSPWRPRRRKRL